MNQQAITDESQQPDLEADVDAVIAACGGGERAAIRALLIANEFLSGELERSRGAPVGRIRAGRQGDAGRSPGKRLKVGDSWGEAD